MSTATDTATHSVRLKAAAGGRLVLAHPGAQPGKVTHNAGTRRGYAEIVYEITGVPAHVEAPAVVRAAEATSLVKWLFRADADPATYTYDWSELGTGRIAR